jgi:hypothetical protein
MFRNRKSFAIAALLAIATASLFGAHAAQAGWFDAYGYYHCYWVWTAYGLVCL